jgi:putative DNA methylase
LQDGYNTKQAISHGFTSWRDFFNDRQLLGLGWLHAAIAKIEDEEIRDLFLLVFSGVLEFNNMFASYKGEGTGAVRHMFAHHILKPERTPIEANIWGTRKSSGSFSNLLRNRIHRAYTYRESPTEIHTGNGNKSVVSSPPFTGRVDVQSPAPNISFPRHIYLSCGDSADTQLPSHSIDLVVTDPPFFDNVHYSELADFFYSWQRLIPRGFIREAQSTRSDSEVQDADSGGFATKLQAVFEESYRVLKPDGLLVFTYHHSREDGWLAVAGAILKSGFRVANAHPVKSEMSVAAPKAQANEPIQLDIILVCRKAGAFSSDRSDQSTLAIAQQKIARLESAGFSLSKNDKKVVEYGQLLVSLESVEALALWPKLVESKTADRAAVGERTATAITY